MHCYLTLPISISFEHGLIIDILTHYFTSVFIFTQILKSACPVRNKNTLLRCHRSNSKQIDNFNVFLLGKCCFIFFKALLYHAWDIYKGLYILLYRYVPIYIQCYCIHNSHKYKQPKCPPAIEWIV